MDAELKKAKLEGRTALAYVKNESELPWSPIFSRHRPKLLNVPRGDRHGFEVHAATRRTTLNPREKMVVRVLLPKPLNRYPADVKLEVSFDSTSVSWLAVLELFPDTEDNR